MPLTILFPLLSGLAFAGAGLGYKMAERRNCRTPVFILVFALAGGICSGARAFFEATDWLDPRLWVLGLAMGLLFDLAIYFIMQANRLGPASASWTVLNLGLLVPVFVSPFILDEPVKGLDSFIVLIFVLMLLMFSRGMKDTGEIRKGTGIKYILMLAGLFLAQGCFLLGNKIKHLVFSDTNTAWLAFIVYFSGGAAVLLYLLATRKRPDITGNELKAGVITGGFNSLGIILLLGGMGLPSAIVFPVSAVIALAGGIVLTSAVYGERLNKWKLAGMVFGLAALILAVTRDL